MQYRAKSNTSILYILITEKSNTFSHLVPPNEFNNSVINFIKECPEDLLQLHDSIPYLDMLLSYNLQSGHDFHVIYKKNISEISRLYKNIPRVKLLFIDADITEHLECMDLFPSQDDFLTYFVLLKSKNTKIETLYKQIINPYEFIYSLIQDQKKILKSLNLELELISPSMFIEHKNINQFYFFSPTKNNYNRINQLIGNFGYFNEKNIDNNVEQETKEAHKHSDSWERQNRFINQIQTIDFFRKVSFKYKILKRASDIEPILSPIIISAPFHNPDVKNIYGDNVVTNSLQSEQTSNYINLQNLKKVSADSLLFGAKLIRRRLDFLDDVGFLHSTFEKSPYIRLPLAGKSLYANLSPFRISAHNDFTKMQTRRKVKRTINKFGSRYSNLFVSPKMKKLLTSRNGQVIVISDLPFEWLDLDGIPFAFTHDICRLTETPMPGLMAAYTSNNFVSFSISENILNRTLVIFGSDEDNFVKWRPIVKQHASKLGFSTTTCSSLKEFKVKIKQLKPELLIFDCHGGYDEHSKSTFLKIGNERLNGDYIVKNKISAPLIFISACGTSPTYGTFNTIANPFFEAGALAVTTTYLPIGIDSGSVLYIRLLNKLLDASKKPIHKNWLEFLSHIIRTSAINEAFIHARREVPNAKKKEILKLNVQMLTDVLYFEKRRDVYKNIDKLLQSLTINQKDYFSSVIPEYLFYSNLGRGDLILFESWREEFGKHNLKMPKKAILK